MRLLRLVICEQHGWLTVTSPWSQAGRGPAHPSSPQASSGGPGRASVPHEGYSLSYCVLPPLAGAHCPLALRLVPLTYCWWRALETRARHTAALEPTTYLPAYRGMWGRGHGAGGEACKQSPCLCRLSAEPASPCPRCSLLLTARRGGSGKGKDLPACCKGQQASLRSHLVAGRREEAGAGGGEGLHHLHARCHRHPLRPQVLPCERFTVHCTP